MDIKIVVDSGGDITQEMGREWGVEVLPILVNDGEREYRDGVDIFPDEFYERMVQGTVFRTSQIAQETYVSCFSKYAETGQPMLYYSLSSALSKTCESAQVAADIVRERYPGAKIAVLDSRTATDGIILCVRAFLDAKKEWANLEEAVRYLEDLRSRTVQICSVNDLKYLYRGGRLSKIGFLVGGALNIKPIIHVNDKGELKSFAKARGFRGVVSKMADIFEEDMKGRDLSDAYIALEMATNAELCAELEAELERRFGKLKYFRNQLGATIGAHIGPDFVGLFYIKPE